MSITAGEPAAAGAGLVVVGAASGTALFSAFGGSFIGAAISVAVLSSQLPTRASQAKRFLTSVFSGPIITLTLLELTNWRLGAYTISCIAMFISFVAWKIFTAVHNRSTKTIDSVLDKALGKALGVNTSDELASVDREYVDSGRAGRWRVGRELDKTDDNEADRKDKGGADGS